VHKGLRVFLATGAHCFGLAQSIRLFHQWDAWTEPSLGRTHPDTLIMGTYKGIETLIWLEVEAGKKSEKTWWTT